MPTDSIRDSGLSLATILNNTNNNKGAREEYSAENMDINLQLYFRLNYLKVHSSKEHVV